MSQKEEQETRDSLLISVEALARGLRRETEPRDGDPGPVVVDCRFNLVQPDAGREAWRQGHIPGAFYADLDRDLSAPRGPGTGRHPLPDPAQLRELFGRFGITKSTQVVAYDDGNGAIAARLWWLLRWMGHARVQLLDGGFAAWKKAGQPVSTASPAQDGVRFEGQPGGMPVRDVSEVARGLADGSIHLLDVRAEERFLGRVEPIDPVAGHIPGAVNAPFGGNLTDDNRFRSGDELSVRYASLLASRDLRNVILMCGSGVTACHGLFALELAGLPGASLYPGSWSEWIRSSGRPVARE